MITRVITGPALVTWNAVTYFTAGDIVVTFGREITDLVSSQHGVYDRRHKSSKITIAFSPVGQINDLVGLMAATVTKVPGQSVVPGGAGVELPLIIYPLFNGGGASRVWTFTRAGLTAWGAFSAGATKPMAPQLTFTALESQVSAGVYFTSASFSAAAGSIIDDFIAADVPTLPLEAVWADDPATLASGDYTINAMDGWSIEPNYTVAEHFREEAGIADVTFVDIRPVISGEAANWYDHLAALVPEQTQATLLPFASRKPGMTSTRKKLSLRALSNDGTGGGASVSDGDIYLQFPKAEIDVTGLAWGQQVNRTGMVRFISTPVFASGVRAAMFDENFS